MQPKTAPPTTQDHLEFHKVNEQRIETLKGELGSFVESQNATNRELFGLIRQTGDAILTKIEHITNTFNERVSRVDGKLAEKGKVTPALFATIFSGLSVILVLGSGYIQLQTGPLQKQISDLNNAVSNNSAQHSQLIRDRHMFELKTTEENAKSEEQRRWHEMIVTGKLKLTQ
jgi:hypothetical protein